MKHCGTNGYYPSTRKNLHKSGMSQSFYVFVRRVLKHMLVMIKAYHCWQLHTKFYPVILSVLPSGAREIIGRH
jgi:hypothetical protein